MPTAHFSRRRLTRALAPFLGGVALSSVLPRPRVARAADDRPRVFIFLYTEMKSGALERILQAKMPSVAITVFGRFKDFEDAFVAGQPDAVVAVGPFLEARRTPAALQGQRAAKEWESYALVSLGDTAASALAGKVVGVVDLLGRTGTQEFVQSMLKTDVKLKRVTKLEDLLPLLQFSAADAVLIPSASARGLTQRSRLALRVRELPEARVGLPGIAVLNPRAKDTVVRQFAALDSETNRALGVERWVTR
jgi:ABC-type amino acid transport substrate-binding protein